MTATDPAVAAVLPAAIELRHRLHRIPELGYAEHKTAGAIRAELTRLGIAFVAGVADAPTATVAWVGDLTLPCVALRADIDALPIEERTGLPYASTHPGRMHACGHDGHTATLLATAAVVKSRLVELPVCVKFLFQPAEEGGGGGKRLVAAGVLDGRVGPAVSNVFGLHGWPGIPVGVVATKAGAMLAATDGFKATFVGRGGHGAYPHLGRDPIVTAATAVVTLQQVASREYDPTDSLVVTVGKFTAGTATNVIPDEATIEGTCRTLTAAGRKQVREAVHRRLAGVAAAGDCDLRFEWVDGYPPTVNDPEMADYVATVAKATVGPDRFLPVGRPSMGGEDFAYYLEQVPGCFFFVGMDPPTGAGRPSLHSDLYDWNDDAIGTGVEMFLAVLSNMADRPAPVRLAQR